MLCDAESDLRKDYDLLGEVDKVTLLERFAIGSDGFFWGCKF